MIVQGSKGQRTVKKRDVKPTIKLELKDSIYQLSSLTFMPVKDVCVELCSYVIHDRDSIKKLSTMFKRDLRFENTMFLGNVSNETVTKKLNGYGERISLRFSQIQYDNVSLLAFALDCTVSRATAILLEMSMSEIKFINQFVKNYLKKELSASQLRQFQQILKYVNKHTERQQSWASLLAHVMDEIGIPASRLKDYFNEFIDTKWRD